MEISVFNIAVCDDMKEITAQLVQIAEQQSMKQIQTAKGFYCGGQLMEYMAKNNVDLLFLDIELGDMTGIDISRKIRKEDHNDTMQIVYMTGKEGYERELFDFQPLNFLAKPLNEAKVRECIAMAYGKWTVRKHKFYYRKYYEIYAVSVGRIISFETDKRYILMTTTEGEERFRATMEQIEEQVRHHGFLKINQAVILNMEYIRQFHKDRIQMSNGKIYYTSRSYQKEAQRTYLKFMD